MFKVVLLLICLTHGITMNTTNETHNHEEAMKPVTLVPPDKHQEIINLTVKTASDSIGDEQDVSRAELRRNESLVLNSEVTEPKTNYAGDGDDAFVHAVNETNSGTVIPSLNNGTTLPTGETLFARDQPDLSDINQHLPQTAENITTNDTTFGNKILNGSSDVLQKQSMAVTAHTNVLETDSFRLLEETKASQVGDQQRELNISNKEAVKQTKTQSQKQPTNMNNATESRSEAVEVSVKTNEILSEKPTTEQLPSDRDNCDVQGAKACSTATVLEQSTVQKAKSPEPRQIFGESNFTAAEVNYYQLRASETPSGPLSSHPQKKNVHEGTNKSFISFPNRSTDELLTQTVLISPPENAKNGTLLQASSSICECGPHARCVPHSSEKKCVCQAMWVMSNGECTLSPLAIGLITIGVLGSFISLCALSFYVVLIHRGRFWSNDEVYQVR